ncbi:ATP-binding protein [Klebsiella quasipneumoniae]|uniref:ATP-binding protein n=1 Tax=Klebsiella quasipneumoniae TaxID=1463165 RepID=UPI0007CBD328|nr:ATP-binding protein [Klebsiella quasipneumoniae]SBK74945.1 histidine kinase [Klebsiella quasipneumoniae]HDG7847050.1 sensor histidine kinase [Klebsiella quasipneumoniae]HDU5806484.1 sensor histidine kinase [Klebsiella quasipneumoniae subsp. quasipneumoniae]
MKTNSYFRANSHLLKLLGDELIGDDRLAVFELVKNAYDADAESVDVELNLNQDHPSIIVYDHFGVGMTKDDFINKWMEIGTKSKRAENRTKTVKFQRLPLGEKGVGRLAVHKLGRKLRINSKALDSNEIEVNIDWSNLLEAAQYIEDTVVEINELDEPVFFDKSKTGTRIEISGLNNNEWSRGDVRSLKRMLTSLVSPFETNSDFKVNFSVPGLEKYLDGMPDADDILNSAIWKYQFQIDNDGKFFYQINFQPPKTFKTLTAQEKKEEKTQLQLLVPTKNEIISRDDDIKNNLLLNSRDLLGIGPIKGVLYVFLQQQDILNALGNAQLIKNYLKEQSGIRVYRDSIRVFNYGEPYDDWLGLNTGRINRPGKKIHNGMIIGSIDLDLESSNELKEKTNREGFDDNKKYRIFRWIISSVIEKFHIEHADQRDSITQFLKGNQNNKRLVTNRFEENISDLKKTIQKHGLEKEMSGKLTLIEQDFLQMREVTINSGIAGVNLAVIFHEVERGVDELNQSIKRSEDYELIKKRAENLSQLLEGFAPLLRRNDQKLFSMKSLVERVHNLTKHRFSYHNVIFSCPLLTDPEQDFKIKAPFGLVQAALNNIIDNAIHWTRFKFESIEDKSYKPAIRIQGLPNFFSDGPALVILDNGIGFNISPEEAIQPFKTTRPSGMGLGLYYADKVMEALNGKLIICKPEDLELSESYDGAVVVLIFHKGNE